MGQRLTATVAIDGEPLFYLYQHWGGYSANALEVLKGFDSEYCNFIEENKDKKLTKKDLILASIKMLSNASDRNDHFCVDERWFMKDINSKFEDELYVFMTSSNERSKKYLSKSNHKIMQDEKYKVYYVTTKNPNILKYIDLKDLQDAKVPWLFNNGNIAPTNNLQPSIGENPYVINIDSETKEITYDISDASYFITEAEYAENFGYSEEEVKKETEFAITVSEEDEDMLWKSQADYVTGEELFKISDILEDSYNSRQMIKIKDPTTGEYLYGYYGCC